MEEGLHVRASRHLPRSEILTASICSDYRGLKKRITAIRRIQEQDNIEPGTTSALALSPYPSAGAPADTGPTTLLEDAETSAPAPVHVAGHGSAVDNAHNNGCASSPVLAHSDTATSSGVLPRLRRRSTVVSRAQVTSLSLPVLRGPYLCAVVTTAGRCFAQ